MHPCANAASRPPVAATRARRPAPGSGTGSEKGSEERAPGPRKEVMRAGAGL